MLTTYNRLTGAQIRLLRERLGLTQVQFASLFNTTHQTIYRWESEAAIPEGPSSAILKALDQGTRERDVRELQTALSGVVLAFGLYFLLQAIFSTGPTVNNPTMTAAASRPPQYGKR